MKKSLIVIAVALFSLHMFGCGKKQVAEESQEPLTMESMSTMGANATVPPPATKPAELKVEGTQAQPVAMPGKLEPLPPAGPFKPTGIEIQTALKNANFYTGNVDGKMGAQTKKAVEEFQKANGLKVDGKVGPKTWEALGKYLSAAPAPAKAVKKNKRP